jgi:(2Fe-2S) ferredoxin
MELVEKFKDAIKEAGLVGKVRAQRAGCLDACKHGPAVVVYPEGTYYGQVGPDDVKRIIEEHVMGGKELADKVVSFQED